jgi:NAD(P)-dependent dehydrogenase (short-subunit alcohol dehydrogenase family)
MKKTAIVTGSAGNLGKAVLKQLLGDGFQVVGTKLPKESLKEFKDKGNFEEYVLNVTEPESFDAFVKHIVNKYGTIDRAALLVGGFAMGDIQNTSLEDVQKMLMLNFESAFVSAKYIFEQMIKQPEGGKIGLVGARPALDPKAGKGLVAYALSKSLIFCLAELLNESGKDKGVHTSVIVPSLIDTPPNRNSMPDANFDDWVKPEEIAEVISFLFSDKASKLRESVVKIYGNS